MKNITNFLLMLGSFTLMNCSDDDFEMFPSDAVTYKVTFNLNWNGTDFPTDYPSNAHFSKLIGWSHQSSSTFFQPGTLASAGIENMAEAGGTSPLDDELQAKIEAGEGLDRVIGSGLGETGVGSISVEIVVHKDHPSVTLATMLAPSPDWYAAVVGALLYENGNYVSNKTMDLLVYDAGTDSGATFTSDDVETSPQAAISMIVDAPLGNGTVITPAIGTVTFEQL
ncbi:MAG: spondin domain-containing protein [Chitinophagales bacterium]